jgi:hypothetical protein
MLRRFAIAGALVLALGASACGGDDDDGDARSSSSSTTSTTTATSTTSTTVPPTTTQPAVTAATIVPPDSERPGATCTSPEAAAAGLLGGFRAGDRVAAGQCASPQALDTLFALTPVEGSPEPTFNGCQIVPGQQRFECSYSEEGGGYQLDVEQAPEHGGFYVDDVHLIS